MEFSYVLKQLRDEKGLSQKDIAEYLGITRQAVALYEVGKREPDYQILRRLADYFGVSIDYLLGRSKCKDVNAVIFGRNIDLIREGRTYEDFSKEISQKTGTLIIADVLEIYGSGDRVPNAGVIKILAKYAGVRESFFYTHNTKESYLKEKEYCKGQAEPDSFGHQTGKETFKSSEYAENEFKDWALKDENSEYIKLARKIKDAGIHPNILLPLIDSMKNDK